MRNLAKLGGGIVVNGYENGISTRKIILNAAIKLFLDKGFHETIYDDICQEAHVHRGSIYYHFKEKENIRYEVLWEITIQNRNLAAQFCEREDFHFLLAIYILWYRLLTDNGTRKFLLDYLGDYPVYHEKHTLSRYCDMLYQNMYKRSWAKKKKDPLANASVYGYIMGMIQLGGTHPESYTPLELLHYTVIYGNMILGISGEDIEKFWSELLLYVELIPLESV